MSAADSREHNAAMLLMIQDICGSLSPARYAGDMVVPSEVKDSTGAVAEYPYAVVYPTGAALIDGSLDVDDLDSDIFPTTQVTCVGLGREQAEWLQSQIRDRILGTYVTVSGRTVGPVRLHVALAAARDDTLGDPILFYALDQYRVFSTPD